MKDTLDIRFDLDTASALDGMVQGGRRVFRGKGRWLQALIYVQQAIIIPLGVTAIFILGHRLIFGEVPEGGWWFIVVFLLGAGFAVWSNMAFYQRVAQMVSTSSFGRGGRMICSADAVTLQTVHSEWRTGWRDVEEVVLGKSSLGLVISGVVLVLPLSAFENVDEMKRAYDQLQDWFETQGNTQ